MIYVTGDTHGTIDYGKVMSFQAKNKNLTRADYLIVCGDFGGLWSKGQAEKELRPYTRLPFTVLFVDGNHENFDMLSSYPVSEWKGGKARALSPTTSFI